MNRQTQNKLTIVLASFLIIGGFISPAKADEASIAVDNLVGGYGRQMTGKGANQLLAPSPSIDFAIGYGQTQNKLTNNNSTTRIPLAPETNGSQSPDATGQDLGQTAVMDLLSSSGTKTASYQQALNSSLYPQSVRSLFSSFGGGATIYTDTTDTVKNYDVKSLLGPVGYADQNAAQTAMNYVKFLAQPAFNADIGTLRSYNSSNFLPYLMAMRSYAAAQSIGISNFYKSFSDRVRLTGLGKQARMSNDNNAPASVLEVEEFAAKKRVTDPEWYKAMETATPATIERETLYVLAEMRLEMYKNRLALERLILTNSAILMQLNTAEAMSQTLPLLKSQITPPKK
jgi:hypothetical protein